MRSEDLLLATGMISARQTRAMDRIGELSEVEWRSFSQWGEDGIIDWLVHQIPDIPRTFVEFGVENYQESNTRMLLQLRNWKGLVMDGSRKNMAHLQRQALFWKYDLEAVSAFIDAENINELISSSGFSGDTGILSIDIDGNDYWVWNAIQCISPVIVICEYNAVLGNIHAISVPYDPQFMRHKAHSSRLYYGASLPALLQLAKQKGYTFLGTNLHGTSGFFVRSDKAEFIAPKIERVVTYPSRFREARDAGGQLLYLSGLDRIQPIAHLPFVRVPEGQTTTLADLDELYSESWCP